MDTPIVINRQLASQLLFLMYFQYSNETKSKLHPAFANDPNSVKTVIFKEYAMGMMKNTKTIDHIKKSLPVKSYQLNGFVQDILYLENIRVSEELLTAYLSYVKDEGKNDKIYFNHQEFVSEWEANLERSNIRLSAWDIDPLQYEFANKYYWLYYYDEVIGSGRRIKDVGVSRALLHLQDFGKATILNYDLKDKKFQTYVGTYEIFKISFLRLNLTLFPDMQKNLICTLFVGRNGATPLAMGQFNNLNVHENIYAGTVIIKKIETLGFQNVDLMKPNEEAKNNVKFFSEKESVFPIDLTLPIRSLLANKDINYISVPNHVIDSDDAIDKIAEILTKYKIYQENNRSQ